MAIAESRQSKVVVNTSSAGELKAACDTGLKEFLKERGYEEMHTHTDVKLVLGYVGIIFCAIDFAYSWKYPFSQTKWFSYISVSVYAVTSALALVYSYVVQRDTFFVGYNKAKGHIVSAGSRTKRNEPTYRLTLTTRPIRGRQDPPVYNSKPLEMKQPFAAWFHDDGEFARQKFNSDVDAAIDALLAKKAE
ncbi:hypothetical protein IW140_000442 [Coemansia sp. RSA 1813]|nr:hypothetical protein EV178_000599 [Coemansia sp. RSA 1646]KAJ1773312.1 hypothetical protein LPJ74_000823 [Coemansia sp. RSA 1843]KAJ2092780.1 hypothetical protein IW138_000875 [Coemansia sp. RSA 986]KAJ2217720.1 hypothetical protein EV179_000205 [Coemansia sp. RSA 487]KAJ2573043.1 hypothetical protein IW140_000442 [Coemansia sp. RSA 1813]